MASVKMVNAINDVKKKKPTFTIATLCFGLTR